MTTSAKFGLACAAVLWLGCNNDETHHAPPLTGSGGQGTTSSTMSQGSTSGSEMGGHGATSTGAMSGTGGTGGGSAGNGGGGFGGTMPGPSCMTALTCSGLSCCDASIVPGGSLPMGRSQGGTDAYGAGSSDELPEHTVTVAAFALDTFEVTVGRFRQFVGHFDGTPPAVDAGAHHLIPNSGWRAEWNASLATSQAALIANLKCSPTDQTWTDSPDTHEGMAQNCVSWFEAFAFCAWDGGYLPTEAEWEYAAAGGSDNRLYPWGSDDPSANTALANDSLSDASALVAVGSHPSGNGKWGHRDLAGGMFEWIFDWYNAAWYSGGGASCGNCANTEDGSFRGLRGGSYLTGASFLRAAARLDDTPTNRDVNAGFRCARKP